jgi:outer membrane protein assembly factor BamB/plastocyanin
MKHLDLDLAAPRRPVVRAAAAWLSAVGVVAALAGSALGAQAQAAPAGEWPQANFDYANTRAAAGSRLSAANVGQLGVAWTFSVPGVSAFGALATTPVVVNGTAYLQDLKSNVYAIDVRTGALKWQKLYDADNVGPNGPAVDGGKVFVESNMQTVAALDASTGAEVWSVQIAPADTQGIDQHLIAYHGTLYVSTVPGPSLSKFYTGGGMGILYALDEETGASKWSFNTVKDGDLWGNPDVNSGGGAWYPPALDTATGTTYWGIGNPAPYPGTAAFPNGTSRPGPNLYADSALAIDSAGQLAWYQQVKPHDLTDADFQISPILATVTSNGASRNIVIGAGKAGYVVGFDKQTGEQVWKTAVGTHLNDDLESFPAGSTTVFPGLYGGVETPMAYADGTVFVPVVNASNDFTPSSVQSGLTVTNGTGQLVAIDAATGTVRWTADLASPDFGAATVAGDLVFTATYDGQVLAFDRASGTQQWTWQAPAGVNGFLAIAGDTVLVPAGLGNTPMLVALRPGAVGTIATAQPAPSAPAAGGGATVAGSQLTISTPAAAPLTFDAATLTVSTGAHVTLNYANDSALPHNWHVYDGSDATAASIATTPIKSGPQDVETVQFTAPAQAGSYYFQCDVHPFMNGQLVVENATP